MALKIINLTLGSGATQAVTPVAGHRTPVQEVTIDPSGLGGTNVLYVGNSSVSTTNYGLKFPGSTAGTPKTIGNGPGALAIFNLEDLWFVGTQNDVVHLLCITL